MPGWTGPTRATPWPALTERAFLQGSWKASKRSRMAEVLSSGLAEIVEDEESVARFLTSASQFNASGAKPSAFLPNPKNGQTSVFRHGNQPSESLWRIGHEHVTAFRTLHGAAIVKTMHIRSAGLDVVAQEPPPRHANIIGWPWSQSDPDLEKAKQKELAALIAQWAEVLPP